MEPRQCYCTYQPLIKDFKMSDMFDVDQLNNLNLEAVEEKVESLRDGGGEVVEASDECEGGACKI
ncbi:hypothetical protein KPN8_230 [Klebsiella phage KPN8]|nr:hypothetical protein KPN8_230 [Klebsiella phage KPN8]